MKSDTIYKRALNRTLELIEASELGPVLPSENAMRRSIGVSRTTVRKVVRTLVARGILVDEGGERRVARSVIAGDYYPEPETTPRPILVERQFMEWMLRGDAEPGMLINELELARQFGVATNSVREFLIRFSRFGFLEKRPSSGWLLKGFTEDFAMDLFEIRAMFELRSAQLFAAEPDLSPLWARLATLKAAHMQLLDEINTRYNDFSNIDDKFHRLVIQASPNRFIDDFYDIISFIFHYHYQWSKKDEKQRNEDAIREHLDYIEALECRDRRRIRRACERHLISARETLLRSMISTGAR